MGSNEHLGSKGAARTLALLALACGSALGSCAPGTRAGPATAVPVGGSLLAQPTFVPGAYAVTPQPFPDADWVAARPYPGYPVYGLFAYLVSYAKLRQDVRDVGWSFLRIGGPLTDDGMRMIFEDGVEASFHVTAGTPATAYATEEEFLMAAEQQTVATLERYGPGGTFFALYPHLASQHIKYAHVWNEPNFEYLIPGPTTPEMQKQRADLYGKLLLRVSAVIRARWPSVTILGFDTGRANTSSTDFVQQVYALHPGVHDAYDVLATHPGVDPVPPETDFLEHSGDYSIAQNTGLMRVILRALGPTSKPIWFTEAGWKISAASGGAFVGDPGVTVSPLLQAAYACRYYATALRLGADRVTPFFIVDANNLNGGFFDEVPLQWRPAAHAVRNMIDTMPHPKLVEVLKDGAGGDYAYRFLADAASGSADTVVMAWSVDGPKTLTLELNAPQVLVVDMLAGTETAQGAGTYDVHVGPYPVYVVEL